MAQSKAQLTQQFRTQILEGKWLPGEKLPSLRKSAKEWQCSLSLMSKVYAQLLREGIISSRERSGYKVSERLSAFGAPKPSLPSNPDEPPSPVWKSLGLYGHEFTPARPISFLAGTPGWLPLQQTRSLFLDILENPSALFQQAFDLLGNGRLRQALSALAQQKGWQLDPGELLTCNNSIHAALQLCLKTVTRPGDRVLVEAPLSPGLREKLLYLGLVPVEVPIHEKVGLSAGAFERALQLHRPAASLLQPVLHYPTGAVMPDGAREAIARISGKLGHPVIECSNHPHLTFSKSPRPLKAFETGARNILWCAGSTAFFGELVNISWIAPGRYFDQVLQHKIGESRQAHLLQEEVLARFLMSDHFKSYLRQFRKSLAHSATQHGLVVEEAFPAGTHQNHAAGGFANWIKLPGQLNAADLQAAARAEGIQVFSGALFADDPNRYGQHLLIHHDEPLTAQREVALRRVGELAHQLLREPPRSP